MGSFRVVMLSPIANDGDLDLYVVNYVHYDLAYAEKNLEVYLAKSQRALAQGIEAYPQGNLEKRAAI